VGHLTGERFVPLEALVDTCSVSPAPSRFWGCSRSTDSGSQLIRL